MDPVPPTTHVHHDLFGDMVVVAAPFPGADIVAGAMEQSHGPGTWCITLEAHNRSLQNLDEQGKAQVSADDFRWSPWSELYQKEQV